MIRLHVNEMTSTALILATCVVDSKVFQLVGNSACSFGILIDALGREPCESLFLSLFLSVSVLL